MTKWKDTLACLSCVVLGGSAVKSVQDLLAGRKEEREKNSTPVLVWHWSIPRDVQGPGAAAWAWWGCLFIDKFSLPWRQGSYFLCKLVLRHSPFFQTFPEIGRRAKGVLGGVDSPLHSMPTSQPHPCACSVLCCAYFQEVEEGCLSQRSAALPPHGPPFQPHFALSHSVLAFAISNSAWLAPQPSGCQCLRYTH